MSSRWIYDDPNRGELRELNLILEPGQEFEAPDDWKPEPYPHPVYKPVEQSKPTKPAPKAPQE